MDIHQNARSTPHSRAAMVRRVSGGETARVVAQSFAVSEKTVRKWCARFRAEGEAGLCDRRSRPRRLYRPTAPELVAQVLALRQQRLLMKTIARNLTLSLATISRLLKRAGLSRLSALDPVVPLCRYE
jgi:transposase